MLYATEVSNNTLSHTTLDMISYVGQTRSVKAEMEIRSVKEKHRIGLLGKMLYTCMRTIRSKYKDSDTCCNFLEHTNIETTINCRSRIRKEKKPIRPCSYSTGLVWLKQDSGCNKGESVLAAKMKAISILIGEDNIFLILLPTEGNCYIAALSKPKLKTVIQEQRIGSTPTSV
ncbi:hypothetical protein BDF20DRAFT_838579 [Mycotypha africana]|uniref:uncharacterized protein n=1 Tax=Mycotypha africana TaxID=64632 RepID=UPI002301F49C|nr:uncharacterized protein BDF20DRAFT_838579 [Mycotypha africana]KAI8970200.1 hypothetical protein BDF20DRAFT_838579 [Mycotypha africana]